MPVFADNPLAGGRVGVLLPEVAEEVLGLGLLADPTVLEAACVPLGVALVYWRVLRLFVRHLLIIN